MTEFEQITHGGVVYEITDNGLFTEFSKPRPEKHKNNPPEDEILLCVEWLEKFAKPQKGINHKIGSYGLKHVVERWANSYVTNGAFIAAALRLDYRIEPHSPKSPNASFRMFIPKKEMDPERGSRGIPPETTMREAVRNDQNGDSIKEING